MASIYPNVKDGKTVSFKFKACIGRDESGKQIFKCTTWKPAKTMSKSKMEAEAKKAAILWENAVLAQIEADKAKFLPQSILFEDFVNQLWFPAQINNAEHRPSTIAFHRGLLRLIVPYFTGRELCAISSSDIGGFLNYLKNDYRKKGNQPLSPKTLRHHYCTLNLIFDYAVKTEYLLNNPLKKVDIPKLPHHKVDALSREEVSIFFNELEKLPLMQRTMYTLLLTTGIRRGECFGLQWGDINFESKTVHVERNVTYASQSGISIGLPKTSTGIREIPLTDRALTLLKAYKQAEEQVITIRNDMYIFHSAISYREPHDPTYPTRHLKKFMKRIGLPDMSPHDLRHTCASLLLQSGADIKSVQDIMGHADASTTLNFYARSNLDNMRESTVKAFDF